MGKEEITFGELWHNIELVAANAERLGFNPGDTFVFVSKPSPRTISMAIGLVYFGMCLAFIDPFTATNSFPVRVGLVAPKLVLAESTLLTLGASRSRFLRRFLKITIADFGSISGTKVLFTGLRTPFLPRQAMDGFKELLRPIPLRRSSRRKENSDSIIVFTSGTTADPNGVVHSLESISANFAATAKIFDFKQGDLVLCEPMTVGLVAASAGATWIIPSKRLPTSFNKYFAVPTDALKLLKQLENSGQPTRTIEYFGMGGAPIPPSLIRRVMAVLGDEVVIPNIYGMTEILPVAHVDGKLKLTHLEGDLLGKPLPGVEVSFAEDFELQVRGAGLMKHYLGQEPKPWHGTGDLARLDEFGNLVMLSRKKNMLIRGDMNIYPSLYEPGIASIDGVQEAVIVGVPDEFGDDRVALFIIPESSDFTQETLKAEVVQALPKHMDQQALPDLILILEKMPVSGRAQKRDMGKLLELARAGFEERAK